MLSAVPNDRGRQHSTELFATFTESDQMFVFTDSYRDIFISILAKNLNGPTGF